MRIKKMLCSLAAIGVIGSVCGLYYASQSAEDGSDADITAENVSAALKNVSDFMNALVSHNNEEVAKMGGSQSYGAYSFLDNVGFDSWEIVSEENGIYTIKLNISESTEEDFPVGESLWTIDASDDEGSLSSFCRVTENGKTVLADNVSSLGVSNAVKMCYAFTSEFGWISSDESIITISGREKTVEKERFIDDLIKFCAYFSGDDELLESDVNFSAEKLSESAERLLGIKELDFTSLPSYNKAKATVSSTRTRYSWGYAKLADEQFSDGAYRVSIDWYSDAVLLAKARSIDYYLADNSDGSIRLISTDEVFNSGTPIAFITKAEY